MTNQTSALNPTKVAPPPFPVRSSEELDARARTLANDGIVVLPGLIPREKTEQWHRAFTQLFAHRMSMPGGLAPREKNRYYLTIPWQAPFADPDVFAHPDIVGVVRRVLGVDAMMVQLGADTPLNGSENQEIHRDHPPLFGEGFHTPLFALAVNFPLVRVTPDNGPFDMARGTHLLERTEALRAIEEGRIPVEQFLLEPGDVMIRAPLALHRGTPNTTDNPRPMVVMGWVREFLATPQVSLEIPRAIYDTFSDEQKHVLRCKVVDDLEDHAETYIEFKH